MGFKIFPVQPVKTNSIIIIEKCTYKKIIPISEIKKPWQSTYSCLKFTSAAAVKVYRVVWFSFNSVKIIFKIFVFSYACSQSCDSHSLLSA